MRIARPGCCDGARHDSHVPVQLVNDRRRMSVPRALRLLDLEPAQATATELRQAYLDLVRVWHPDRFGADTRLQLKAAGRLSEINLAYEFLLANPIQPIAPGGEGHPGHRPTWGVAPSTVSSAAATPRTSRSRRRAGRALGQFGIAAAIVATLIFIATPRPGQRDSAPVRHADTLLQAQSARDVRPAASQGRSIVTPPRRSRSPFSSDLDRVLARARAETRAQR